MASSKPTPPKAYVAAMKPQPANAKHHPMRGTADKMMKGDCGTATPHGGKGK